MQQKVRRSLVSDDRGAITAALHCVPLDFFSHRKEIRLYHI